MNESEFEKLVKGDWVLYKGTPKQIDKHVYQIGGAAYVKIEGESGEVSRNLIIPMPLSDIILLKNGFKYESCNVNILTFKDNMKTYISIKNQFNGKWILYDRDRCDDPKDDPESKNVQYVHELQRFIEINI